MLPHIFFCLSLIFFAVQFLPKITFFHVKRQLFAWCEICSKEHIAWARLMVKTRNSVSVIITVSTLFSAIDCSLNLYLTQKILLRFQKLFLQKVAVLEGNLKYVFGSVMYTITIKIISSYLLVVTIWMNACTGMRRTCKVHTEKPNMLRTSTIILYIFSILF